MFDPAVFGTLFIVVVLIVFVLAVIVANIKIVPQAHAFVVAVSYTHLDVYKRQAMYWALVGYIIWVESIPICPIRSTKTG